MENFSKNIVNHLYANSGNTLLIQNGLIIKKADTNSLQSLLRLKKQILKQQKAFNEILNDFNDILVPKVFNFDITDDSNKNNSNSNNDSNNSNDHEQNKDGIYMEFIPYDNIASFLPNVSVNELDWIWSSIFKYLNRVLNDLSLIYIPLYDLYDIFIKKKNEIIINLNKGYGTSFFKHNTIEKKDFILKIEKFLNNSLEILLFKNVCNIEIPLGYCHGDLNFSNMLANRTDHVLYLIDFLDTFIESPLQDIASLRQDTYCYLFYHLINNKNDNKTNKQNNNNKVMKIKEIMQYFDEKLIKAFCNKKWWPIVNIFLFWKLARILPYSHSMKVTTNIIENMNRVLHSLLSELMEENNKILSRTYILPPDSNRIF